MIFMGNPWMNGGINGFHFKYYLAHTGVFFGILFNGLQSPLTYLYFCTAIRAYERVNQSKRARRYLK